VLVQVKNKRERLLSVRPAGEEKTSRLRSSDSVASGVKCWPHGGKNNKMKSVDGFLVEPQNQGRAGTLWEPSSRGLRWFTRKSPGYSAEPQSRDRRPGVAVWPKPALPVWRTGLTGLGTQGAGSFEAEDTRRDRKACVEATRSAVARHPSDGATKTKFPEYPWWACILV
jgi:hypothetical protein